MNTYTFVGALVIAGLYLLMRFLEMRFILKENKPLKILLREAVMVYLSVLGGDFIIQQLEPLKATLGAPSVFTAPPDF
mgnify:FL=1|jgi:hypothetical protein|tara:strand:+ start:261 stop:494 length:234 start_codon:yes stop_codon:yes gene_type:complete